MTCPREEIELRRRFRCEDRFPDFSVGQSCFYTAPFLKNVQEGNSTTNVVHVVCNLDQDDDENCPRTGSWVRPEILEGCTADDCSERQECMSVTMICPIESPLSNPTMCLEQYS